MARSGKAHFGDLENFKKKVEKSLSDKELDQFIDSCAKELAARFLAKVIKRTPVGQYPKSSGKKGGTLRRGWTNGQNQAAHAYANSLKVFHYGDAYVIEIINPVHYAPYVEYGHRTRNGGWVEGRFMLTISAQEVQSDAPRVLQNKLKKKLGEVFK